MLNLATELALLHNLVDDACFDEAAQLVNTLTARVAEAAAGGLSDDDLAQVRTLRQAVHAIAATARSSRDACGQRLRDLTRQQKAARQYRNTAA